MKKKTYKIFSVYMHDYGYDQDYDCDANDPSTWPEQFQMFTDDLRDYFFEIGESDVYLSPNGIDGLCDQSYMDPIVKELIQPHFPGIQIYEKSESTYDFGDCPKKEIRKILRGLKLYECKNFIEKGN